MQGNRWEGKGRGSFLGGGVADVRRRKEIDEEGKGRRSLLGGGVAEVQRRGAVAQRLQQASKEAAALVESAALAMDADGNGCIRLRQKTIYPDETNNLNNEKSITSFTNQ